MNIMIPIITLLTSLYVFLVLLFVEIEFLPSWLTAESGHRCLGAAFIHDANTGKKSRFVKVFKSTW